MAADTSPRQHSGWAVVIPVLTREVAMFTARRLRRDGHALYPADLRICEIGADGTFGPRIAIEDDPDEPPPAPEPEPDWAGPPRPEDWAEVYRLCLERAREELNLPPGEAERWANAEADRLMYGGGEDV